MFPKKTAFLRRWDGKAKIWTCGAHSSVKLKEERPKAEVDMNQDEKVGESEVVDGTEETEKERDPEELIQDRHLHLTSNLWQVRQFFFFLIS